MIYDFKYFSRKVDTFILVFTALPSLLDLSQVYAMYHLVLNLSRAVYCSIEG